MVPGGQEQEAEIGEGMGILGQEPEDEAAMAEDRDAAGRG